MSRKLIPIIAFLVLLGLWGCRTLPPAPPPFIRSAPEVLARLQSRQESLQSFQARGRLTYLSPERNYSGTSLMKGILPATLRVDILDPLGRSVLNFYSDGREVQVLFPTQAKFFQAPATPQALAAFIPPGMTLPQTLRCLTGNLPLSPGQPESMQYEPEPGMYLMEWHTSNGARRERLWVDARELYPVKGEWYDDAGRLVFTIELKDYGALAPGRPQQIKVITRQPAVELRLAYRDMQVNQPLKAGDLQVPRPPTAARIQP